MGGAWMCEAADCRYLTLWRIPILVKVRKRPVCDTHAQYLKRSNRSVWHKERVVLLLRDSVLAYTFNKVIKPCFFFFLQRFSEG